MFSLGIEEYVQLVVRNIILDFENLTSNLLSATSKTSYEVLDYQTDIKIYASKTYELTR